MATLMIWVRMIPLAPTRAPAMMRSVLSSTKPVAEAARPDIELSRAITTGMSAPPMGITTSRPSTDPTATSAQSQTVSSGSTTTITARPRLSRAKAEFTILMPENPCQCNDSRSLANATTDPVNVTAPIIAVAAAATDV